ncbi:MAG: hypothetical protein HQL46_04350 [Gammaproteobacteria bacterium]|nr:hypothetical protein [Gammaproteobacteria bacterium]
MELQVLTTFLGWCTVINIGILMFTTIILILVGEYISTIHSKLFGFEQIKVKEIYFQYLGYYKVAIIIINLTPYLALKLMA